MQGHLRCKRSSQSLNLKFYFIYHLKGERDQSFVKCQKLYKFIFFFPQLVIKYYLSNTQFTVWNMGEVTTHRLSGQPLTRWGVATLTTRRENGLRLLQSATLAQVVMWEGPPCMRRGLPALCVGREWSVRMASVWTSA